MEVWPLVTWPTCFQDFLVTSRRSTMYSEMAAPPSDSGAFHRSSIEFSDLDSTEAGPRGGDGLSLMQRLKSTEIEDEVLEILTVYAPQSTLSTCLTVIEASVLDTQVTMRSEDLISCPLNSQVTLGLCSWFPLSLMV